MDKTIRKMKTEEGLIADLLELATKFNRYFINIGLKLANSILNDTEDVAMQTMETNLHCSIYLKPVTVEEIIKVIGKLKNASASINQIKADVLKATAKELAEPLVRLINESFRIG